jgi:hypothetical protein
VAFPLPLLSFFKLALRLPGLPASPARQNDSDDDRCDDAVRSAAPNGMRAGREYQIEPA